MKITISNIYGQIYLLPFLKITNTRILNGDLEIIIGWLNWELIIGI